MKKLIIFDMDGTIAESKAALDGEMAGLIWHLLEVAKVSVISGGVGSNLRSNWSIIWMPKTV